MTEESISKIALKHTQDISLLFAQMPDFQRMMVDHLRVYQALLSLSCEIVDVFHQRHPHDERLKRWMATAGLLMSHAPFHEEKGDYAALIQKTHQCTCRAFAEQQKK